MVVNLVLVVISKAEGGHKSMEEQMVLVEKLEQRQSGALYA